nr:hypothetical protein [Tanacetum cinerariifolium]
MVHVSLLKMPIRSFLVFESDVKGSTASSSSTQNVAFISSDSTNITNEVSTAYGVSTSSGHNSQKEGSSSYTDELMYSFFANQSSVDWTGHAKDHTENYALMAFNFSNSSSDTEMSAKDKFGLGRSSDVKDSPVNDRFAKVKGMHAVPPPMTGIYMPPKSNFGIDESKFIYGPKQSITSESDVKTNNFDSCESNSSVETLESVPKPVESKPKAISEPKVWSDAPIIEEYESDSDNEYVFKALVEQEKPSCAFINIVKHVKTSMQTVKDQDTCSQNHKVPKRDWTGLMSKRLGLGYGYTRKACFVCGSFSHLIRDCDFHEKIVAKQVELKKSKNKDNPHQTLKGKGIVDSGCSRHMTRNKAYLLEYQDFIGGPVAFGGSKGQITSKGKQHKASCKAKLVSSISWPLQILHMDLVGPTSDEASGILKDFIRQIENQLNQKVKTIRCDNGTEFKNRDIIELCASKRIKMEFNSFLPNTFWAEAVSTACYVLNRVLVTKPQNKTPYELLTENKANKTAGLKEANNSAGIQDTIHAGNSKMEVEHVQEYYVLPLWSFYTSTVKSSKAKNGDVKLIGGTGSKTNEEPVDQEDQAFLEELESLKRQAKEADDVAETLRNTFAKSTDNLLLQAGAARELFNTASTPVNTARQEEGIDYDELFALVAKIEAIMIFLAFASYMGFIVYQLDVKRAFVYKVVKALYGLHQALRAWYATLSTFLVQSGYKGGLIDKTLFIKKDKKDIMLVQAYVDDIIFGSIKKSWCDEFKALMKSRFQMSSELTIFLGLQVKQKEDGIFISQDKYVAKILKKFDFMSVKTTSTLIETKKPLVKDAKVGEVDVHLYRSMIGSLMYLTAFKLDIMYLKGQPTLGLWYPRESTFDLEAYSDSDYAGANLDMKSTTGEYVAAASCCGQVLWIKNQMLDYGFNFMNTKIYIDNESIICIVKNPVFHSKTNHIEIRHHFIRYAYEKKLIQVLRIHTDDNVADILTKAFDVSRQNLLLPGQRLVLPGKKGVSAAGETLSTTTLAVSTVSIQPVLVLLKLLCSYWV